MNPPIAGPPGELSPVWSAVARVRRRLRVQAAARLAIWGLLIGAAGLLVVLLLVKLHLVTGRVAWWTGIGGGVLTGLLALGGALRRIDPLRVAARIDHSHELRDRLASALQFATAPEAGAGEQISAALRALAMQDAARAAQGVSPAIAAPWQRPPHLALLVVLLAANLVAGVVRLPRFRSAVPPTKPTTAGLDPSPHLIADPELLAPEKEDLAAALAEAQKNGDAATAAVLQELQKLLEQVERGELTRQEAFARLSELEQRLMQGKDGTLEDLKQQLRKAGSELGEAKLSKELGQALVREDLDKAQSELKKLAAQALARSADSQPSRDKQAMAQAFEQAARSLSGKSDPSAKREDPKDPAKQKDQWKDKTKNEEQTRKMQELRDEERRLKQKLQEHPEDQETERRLKKTQRELEQLEQEKTQRDEARRELEQLEKDLERAAAEMQKQLEKMSPEEREAMKQLAQDLSRMADEVRKLEKQQKGRGQGMTTLSSIKTVLRRIARSMPGGGQQGQGQGQGQDGQGKDGKGGPGGKGGGQGKSGAMKDFQDRAKGKGQGQDDDVLVLGEGQGDKGDGQVSVLGEGEGTVLLPGMGGNKGGPPPGQGPGGPGQGQPGDGIGNQHDPNLLGNPTQLDSKRRLTKITGKEGAGPTRSETILGASERGFASAPYRKVYVDYAGVSEQVMSKERVPPGYRFYVKRYFQMIKPRE